MSRVQVVLSEIEREEFRRAAAREGLSMSEFLRRAARDRLAALAPKKLSTAEDLEAFFRECDRRQKGLEPDWEQHRAVIEESKVAGKPTT